MKEEDRNKLNRMLSGNEGLSVQEKERMFETILSRSGDVAKLKPLPRLKGRLWIPALGAVAAAVLAAVLLLPADPQGTLETDAFTARGGDNGFTGAFQVKCMTGGQERKGPCRLGDTLVFRIDPPDGASFFSTAALGSRGKLIWYLSLDGKVSRPVEGGGILDEGIVIGSDHVADNYRVFGIFSEDRLDKRLVRTAIESFMEKGKGRPGVDAVILMRTLEVVDP